MTAAELLREAAHLEDVAESQKNAGMGYMASHTRRIARKMREDAAKMQATRGTEAS